MSQYVFLDGYPYCALSGDEGFQLKSCMILHLKNNQTLTSWYYNEPAPMDFPEKWLRQFWSDLAAAPQFVVREDQWSSDYYSILGNHLIAWTDDRKEGTNFLGIAIELEKCLDHWSVSDAVRAWIRTRSG